MQVSTLSHSEKTINLLVHLYLWYKTHEQEPNPPNKSETTNVKAAKSLAGVRLWFNANELNPPKPKITRIIKTSNSLNE